MQPRPAGGGARPRRRHAAQPDRSLRVPPLVGHGALRRQSDGGDRPPRPRGRSGLRLRRRRAGSGRCRIGAASPRGRAPWTTTAWCSPSGRGPVTGGEGCADLRRTGRRPGAGPAVEPPRRREPDRVRRERFGRLDAACLRAGAVHGGPATRTARRSRHRRGRGRCRRSEPDNSAADRTLLRERGITVLTHTAPTEFDAERGELFVPMAGTIHVEAAVALPGADRESGSRRPARRRRLRDRWTTICRVADSTTSTRSAT